MNEMLHTFRLALSEGGDTGMLVAADAFQEASVTADDKPAQFAELLRKYIDLQTCVRMSQVPPLALVKRYEELNNAFNAKPTLVRNGGGEYSKPFGPLYTALTISQDALTSSLDALTEQPVRELSVTNVRPGGDFNVMMRNYRTDQMFTIDLKAGYSYRQNNANIVKEIAEGLKGVKAAMLLRLTVSGVTDTKKMLQLFFQMSKVKKGCELWVSPNSWDKPVHVATKRL